MKWIFTSADELVMTRIPAVALAAALGVLLAAPAVAIASASSDSATHTVGHGAPRPAAHSTAKPKHKTKHHHRSKQDVIDTPGHVKVVKVGATSFTVSVPTRAKTFRLYASTNHHSLGVVELTARTKVSGTGSAVPRHSSAQPGKQVTVRGLPFSIAPYFYRVEAFNGPHHRWGPILGAVGLLPATPTDLVATSSPSGLALSWRSGPATGYRITQATDSAMSQSVRTYTTEGSDTTFTPYGLTDGTTYYFTVQALNGTTASTPTAPASQVPTTSEQGVRVMTYNIMEGTGAGTLESGTPLASWPDRQPGAVHLIQQAHPDVISIQEAAAWVGDPSLKVRQIDDLTTALGGTYTLADTEVPPTQRHYFRTGVYILYNQSVYTAIGAGGHFDLGDTRWAAYQVLQNTATGAEFLFVAPHLEVGAGTKFDQMRQDETTSMVEQSNAVAQPLGIPVVYAGDFNTDTDPTGPASDGPVNVMDGAADADAYDVAQSRTAAKYNSANRNLRTPPAYYQHIDYVFVPQGVAVKDWVNELDLTNGKFVGTIPSDHNPVYADIVIPYTPSTGPTSPPTSPPPSS
jgi:endonuclease/exonuclease/phosphatase family metal-dependent hydrolase